jgi:hypothetical protein
MSAKANPLITLLGLEEQTVKAASKSELAFLMVNDTYALVTYQQCLLLDRFGSLVAASGVSTIEKTAPFALWLKRVFKNKHPFHKREAVRVSARDIAGQDGDEWTEWFAPHALCIGFHDENGHADATLIFTREKAWEDQEITLLSRLCEIYSFAWRVQNRAGLFSTLKERVKAIPYWRWGLGLVLIACLFLPIRLSVLAPAEIVPYNPAVIRAPVEGIIDKVLVSPNQQVATDTVLFTFDQTAIIGKIDVSNKALSSAKALLDQVTQQAFWDPKANGQLAVLKAQQEEKRAELAQLTDYLSRTEIKSPRAGLIVMDDASEWIGRPVSVGEKVLSIAAPGEVEVEAWLAPADVIPLTSGDKLTLFLNNDPLSPVQAELKYIAYEATLQASGLLAHRLRASLIMNDTDIPRLGLKGTARLDGEKVSLAYWLFRRPLASIREWVGL